MAFESISQPGSFIRHQNYLLQIHVESEDDLYRNDASFEIITDNPGRCSVQKYS